MGDILIQFTGPPDKHKDLVSQINSWKYEVEGKYTKGKQAPYIYETRTYILRVPEQIEGDVLRDLGLNDLRRLKNQVDTLGMRIIGYLHRFLLKLTPLEYVEPRQGERKYSLPSWFYCVQIGKLKRKPVKVLGGKPREVL
jgi:hypothetical protein